MYTLLWIIHLIVCVFLIGVVLLQSGKAADLAGAFGGMGSQTAFGPRGSATLLSRLTTISAVLFMITSLSLSILATRSAGLGSSVLEATPAKTSAPKSQPVPVSIPGQQQPPAGSVTVPLQMPAGAQQSTTTAPSTTTTTVPAPPTPAKK